MVAGGPYCSVLGSLGWGFVAMMGAGVAARTSGTGVLAGTFAGTAGLNSFHNTTPTARTAQPTAISVPMGTTGLATGA